MNLLRQFLHLAASAAALLTVSRIAWAQAYPSRPITLIVPIAADGGLDTRARILSEKLQEELRQPLIVENRPGAGSTLGSAFVADLALGRPPRSLRECSKQPT
jgi:tripartite-type tricarboxylate transporter receptor subunit TctC